MNSSKVYFYSKFDSSSLASALKELWLFCRVDLETQGFTYQQRRNSDKKALFEVIFSDLIIAFEKLDLNN